MKIVTDFDGVLTDQSGEASRVRELFCSQWQSLGRIAASDMEAWVCEAERTLTRAPAEYGWRYEGRITAFSDEDLFIRNNALAGFLDSAVESENRGDCAADLGVLQASRTALALAGVPTFEALADRAFGQMIEETRTSTHKPLDDEGVEFFKNLLGCGAQVVVVSNSGTERILDILGQSGLRARAHADDSSAAFRVRGDARKFVLDGGASVAETRTVGVGGRVIELERPHYARILEEEKPDLVIGDVFSLDLALPYARFPRTGLVLRRRAYTPSWMEEFVGAKGPGTDRCRIVDSLSQVG